jgi:hypothetical protein
MPLIRIAERKSEPTLNAPLLRDAQNLERRDDHSQTCNNN